MDLTNVLDHEVFANWQKQYVPLFLRNLSDVSNDEAHWIWQGTSCRSSATAKITTPTFSLRLLDNRPATMSPAKIMWQLANGKPEAIHWRVIRARSCPDSLCVNPSCRTLHIGKARAGRKITTATCTFGHEMGTARELAIDALCPECMRLRGEDRGQDWQIAARQYLART